jgi:CHAD domain-containing protein
VEPRGRLLRHGGTSSLRAVRPHDNVQNAIQLEVRNSTQICRRLLAGRTDRKLTDTAVHEIRTRVKKLRTLLRLARSDLGKTRYQEAKQCLQQANQPLASIRDARVMLSTCDGVLRRWDRVDRTRLRATMQRRLEAARAKASPNERRTLATKLADLQRLLADWPQSHIGWKSLSRALRRSYAGGRRALASAHSTPSDANLHELRKRAKDLLYTCTFLREVSPHAEALVSDLDRFTEILGTDHDMALLHLAATAGSLARREPIRVHLSRSAVQEQTALRKRAWKLGARIYRATPAVFTKQIHEDWKDSR